MSANQQAIETQDGAGKPRLPNALLGEFVAGRKIIFADEREVRVKRYEGGYTIGSTNTVDGEQIDTAIGLSREAMCVLTLLYSTLPVGVYEADRAALEAALSEQVRGDLEYCFEPLQQLHAPESELLAAARHVLSLLDHPERSVTALDADRLRAAVVAVEAPSPTTTTERTEER